MVGKPGQEDVIPDWVTGNIRKDMVYSRARRNASTEMAMSLLDDPSAWEAYEHSRPWYPPGMIQRSWDRWGKDPRMVATGQNLPSFHFRVTDYMNSKDPAERERLAAGWPIELRKELDEVRTARKFRAFAEVPEEERLKELNDALYERLTQWGGSSGDGWQEAVWMQRAISQELRVTGRWGVRVTEEEEKEIFSRYTPEVERWYRRVARTLYEHNQAALKASNIQWVTLYRGMNFDYYPLGPHTFPTRMLNRDELPAWVRRALDTGVTEMDFQPANSWTSKRATAKRFGQWLFAARFPAERILSTSRTGFGCTDEYEAVVLNGRGLVRLVDHPTEATWKTPKAAAFV